MPTLTELILDTLMLTFFYRFMRPELIEDGHVYIAHATTISGNKKQERTIMHIVMKS